MKRIVSESRYHHEELFFNQKEFKEQASGLVRVIRNLGNPFIDDSNEL